MASENTNVQAFLRLIRFVEHHKDSDATYKHVYGAGSCGPGTFTDMSKHPNIMVACWGNKSTAAGAYQILYGTWAEAKDKGIARFHAGIAGQDRHLEAEDAQGLPACGRGQHRAGHPAAAERMDLAARR